MILQHSCFLHQICFNLVRGHCTVCGGSDHLPQLLEMLGL